MANKIPYVISEAYPDYKRPCLHQQFGSIDENLKDTFFVEKVAEFIYERTDANNDIKSVDDIHHFWETYYDDAYMDNTPWDAKVFINNNWKTVIITELEIFECINRIKLGEIKINDFECDKEEQIEDILDNIEWNLTDEEHEIQEKMREYMDSELETSDLELMSEMNQTEQTIYVLNKCMINISSEKYKSNRELFHTFLNIILKYTEKDISIITEEMENNHSEELSLKLKTFMNIYGSLLEYRTIFNVR